MRYSVHKILETYLHTCIQTDRHFQKIVKSCSEHLKICKSIENWVSKIQYFLLMYVEESKNIYFLLLFEFSIKSNSLQYYLLFKVCGRLENYLMLLLQYLDFITLFSLLVTFYTNISRQLRISQENSLKVCFICLLTMCQRKFLQYVLLRNRIATLYSKNFTLNCMTF